MNLLSSCELADIRREMEANQQKLVLTNGVFDLLHVGHVRYLQEARKLGDALVVAINDDESVTELKGPGRPINSAEDRAELLLALSCVDYVVIFAGKRASDTIETIVPHIYTKGGDYTKESLIDEERKLLEKLGVEIEILSLVAGKSTTATLQAMTAGEGSEAERKQRLAILGSGAGSNADAIMQAIADGELTNVEVGVVISDREDAGILERAKAHDVPTLWIPPGTDKGGVLTDAALKELTDRMKALDIDLVVLAGYMRIVRGVLLDSFAGRMINIHPSLLPAYPGLHPIKRALASGEKETGCTIHRVDAGIDTGEILAQVSVPIQPDDTEESLTLRVHQAEHKLYPRVIQELVDSASASPS